jgi:hypothetical protein
MSSSDRPVDKSTRPPAEEKPKQETSNQATATSDSNQAGTKNKRDPFDFYTSSSYLAEEEIGKEKSKKG